MNAAANKLIGKKVQMPESTRRAMVAEFKDGWTKGTTILVFTNGTQAMYQDSDIDSMVVDGTHNHQVF